MFVKEEILLSDFNLEERFSELPATTGGNVLTESDQELIHYIGDKISQGQFDIVSTTDNPNWDEYMYKELRNIWYDECNKDTEANITLSTLFKIFSDIEAGVVAPVNYSNNERYYPPDPVKDEEFIQLILFDTEIPESGRTMLLPTIWRKRPMSKLNAVKVRNEIKNYLDYKNVLFDKCGMKWHISVPEICLVLGVSVEEWLKYDEPDQIKDAKDYFTSLVLAQGVSMMHDPMLKNPAGVMADMKAHAGLEDISHIKVHSNKKRKNVVKLHKRTETK